MSNKDNTPESPEYIQQWASELLGAVSRIEAESILADFTRLSRDQSLTEHDRQVAAQRAQILEKLL